MLRPLALVCCALTALVPVRTERAGESVSIDIPTTGHSANTRSAPPLHLLLIPAMGHYRRLRAPPRISTFGDTSLKRSSAQWHPGVRRWRSGNSC
jgi:hypothetical protein